MRYDNRKWVIKPRNPIGKSSITDLLRMCVCVFYAKGDYGGPLVCYGTSGFVQVGIMSYENPDGCATPGHVGIYTRVSKYLRFINDYINL